MGKPSCDFCCNTLSSFYVLQVDEELFYSCRICFKYIVFTLKFLDLLDED